MIYLPIQGTDSVGANEWWNATSQWAAFLDKQGWHHIAPDDPFEWSTDIDGVDVWDRLRGKADPHRDWFAGGDSLRYFLRDIPYENRNLIAHSHGMQVALYGATKTPIRSLISIAGPVRKDMADIAAKARSNIGRWVHVTDEHWDHIAFLGQLFDGAWFGGRTHPLADVNLRLKGISHSNLLSDPKFYHFWPEQIFPAEKH